MHDAGLVEAHELAFGEVRNVAGDFFGAELRVAGDHGELFDVDRRVAVVGDDAFGDQHRVFVVVAVPRHEGDQHVLTEGEFAHVGRSAVGNDVAAFNAVALDDDRTLIDVRRLVRTGELLQVVDVHARFAHHAFVVVDADHDAVGVHEVDHAAAAGLNGRLRVNSHRAFNAGADDRLFRTQAGHALTLHVRAHQSAVRVVVFQERNQGGGAGNDLRRSDVHVLDAFGRGENRFAVFTGGHEFLRQTAVFIHVGVGLSDDVAAFLDRGEVTDFLRGNAVDHLAVRRFEEAVFVEAGIEGERVDQTDVRTFRRFDRADAAVVGRVHVADFEAGAFTRQTARAESGNTALVRDFRERIRLVHELRKLARTEEFADRGGDGLRIDQVLRGRFPPG